jgi:hypothetical protein
VLTVVANDCIGADIASEIMSGNGTMKPRKATAGQQNQPGKARQQRNLIDVRITEVGPGQAHGHGSAEQHDAEPVDIERFLRQLFAPHPEQIGREGRDQPAV